MQEPNITVFGAPGCPDCRRSKQFLGEQRIPFVWVTSTRTRKAERGSRKSTAVSR